MADASREQPPDEDLSTIRHTGSDPASPLVGGTDTWSRPATSPTSQPTRPKSPKTDDFTLPQPTGVVPPTEPPSGGSNDRMSATIEAADLDGCAPGQILFDRYLVERQIGSGGMGTVWLVKHSTLGVRRALKLIRPQIAFDPKTRADFRREAMIMANLHHPNAVMVHDARIGADLAYIEMEYLEGKSIEKRLGPGEPMPLDWVARILDQLCELLAFVHAKGVVHRDLKPSNLLLLDGHPEGREFLKVLDFGIAKSLNPEFAGDGMKTLTGGALYTPHYASPEQVGGGKDLDARSDLYSVGVILYEFLTGYRPFSEPGLVYKQLCVPAPPFKERNPRVSVPAEVEKVVLSCLEKDPAHRPKDAAELAERFHAALEGTGFARTSVEPKSRLRTGAGVKTGGIDDFAGAAEPERRSRTPVYAAFAVLAIVGVLLVLSIVTKRPAEDLSPTLKGGGPTTASNGGASTAPTVAPPPPVRRADLAFGYSADPGAKVGPTGWPLEILDGATGDHFVLFADGVYIPESYDPEDPKDLVGAWPRVLVRRGAGGGRFVRIEGGTYPMGGLLPAEAVKPGAEIQSDLPVHQVSVPDFYIQESEVTNAQMEQFRTAEAVPASAEWRNFADGMGADGRQRLAKRAATFVSRMEAAQYARYMKGRLPTEAEWEFAARSRGKRNLYVWGAAEPNAELTNINNAAILGGSSIPIAEPGAFAKDRTEQGLVDLSGNVREWCFDVFAPYLPKDVAQPANPELVLDPKLNYVVRGSSYYYDADRAFTSARTFEVGSQVAADLGFRIVLRVPPAMK